MSGAALALPLPLDDTPLEGEASWESFGGWTMARRRLACGLAAVLLVLVGAADTAAAQEPVITVTPDSDLTAGQVVTVAGSGFSTSTSVAAGQCPARAADITDISTLLSICENIRTSVAVEPNGSFSFDLRVLRLLDSVDCATESCIILVRDLSSGVQAVAPLSFRPGPLPVPRVTVTPQVGLADAQTVTVTGTGFIPGFGVTLAQCVDEASGVTDLSVLASSFCGGATFDTVPGPDGIFTVAFDVVRVRPTQFVGGTVACGEAPSDCFVLILQRDTRLEVPISFGPPLPQAKADCKNGGWRNLANDQGRPFRNQGQCVSFVVAHRR